MDLFFNLKLNDNFVTLHSYWTSFLSINCNYNFITHIRLSYAPLTFDDEILF